MSSKIVKDHKNPSLADLRGTLNSYIKADYDGTYRMINNYKFLNETYKNIFLNYIMTNATFTSLCKTYNVKVQSTTAYIKKAFKKIISNYENLNKEYTSIGNTPIDVLLLKTSYQNALGRSNIKTISDLEKCIKDKSINGMRGLSSNAALYILSMLKVYYNEKDLKFPNDLEEMMNDIIKMDTIPYKFTILEEISTSNSVLYKIEAHDLENNTKTYHIVECIDNNYYIAYFSSKSKNKYRSEWLIDAVKEYKKNREK